jgi:AraC-like DNA-binding protein
MPSANHIRKEILLALENHILPALWRPNLSIGNVAPPLDFSGKINARLLKSSVPRRDTSDIEFPLQTRWPSADMHSSHFPYLGFLYEGVADEKTIVTAEQAAKHHISKGIYAIRWHAPSALVFPPGAPRRGGGEITFWEGPQPVPPMKILWISIWSELLIHTHSNDGDNRHVSHSLHINDPSTIALSGLLVNELQSATVENQQVSQAILLAMMLCLHRNLLITRPKLGNTSRSPIPALDSPFPGEHASETCRDAAAYIQMHLHESLSLSDIASQVHFSPAHLNRLFRRLYGISVMRYVRTQRIAAAKNILKNGPENIAEIAQLVGYKRTNLFCRVFREEEGLTPSQFRRNARRDKSTF